MSEEYRVKLDVFSGPLDLLLFLIKRDELDIQDVPLTRLTEQYLEYVKLLEQLDPNSAGDFLVMASTLIELKSRSLLPTPPLESMEDDDDPRAMLVRQLLEYKRFKDVAAELGRAADDRAKRYARKPVNLPRELEGVELEEVEVWDLLSAFAKVMSSIGAGPGILEVSTDDRSIADCAASIVETLELVGPSKFESVFGEQLDRAEIVSLFLAVLELIRLQRIRAEQAAGHGTIYLFLLEEVGELPEDAFLISDQVSGEPATTRIGNQPEGMHEQAE